MHRCSLALLSLLLFCQVIDHKLPKAYDYPRSARALPAPFIQIRLLKILAVLGAGEKVWDGAGRF